MGLDYYYGYGEEEKGLKKHQNEMPKKNKRETYK
jgi:hypothetical protein